MPDNSGCGVWPTRRKNHHNHNMKIQIDYFLNKEGPPERPCGAETELRGSSIVASGETWNEAKKNLVGKVERIIKANLPPREYVDIPEGSEEEMFPTLEDFR
jgi:hypothetical protein